MPKSVNDKFVKVLLILVSNVPAVTPVKLLVGKLIGGLHVYFVAAGTKSGSTVKLAPLQIVADLAKTTGTGFTITEIICSLEQPLAVIE